MKKKIALILVLCMITSLCACGAKEEKNTEASETMETDDIKETESPEKSDEVSDEADSEEAEDEYGFTETQIQKLYDSIGESVKTEYLEPNGIAPEELKWPDYPQEISTWMYLQFIFLNYLSNGEMYDSTGLNESDIPSDDNMKLMNAVLDGIVNWEKLPENAEVDMYELPNILIPPQLHEIIPSNVKLAE